MTAVAAVVFVSAVSLASQLPAQERFDLPHEDRLLTANFEEVYRVGAPAVLLSDVRAAEFGHDGTLYVLDALSQSSARLLAIHDDGRSVHNIGRPGGGPGEYRAIPHFAPLSDGRLAVFDVGHNAYHIFSSDGLLQRMVEAGGSDLAAGFGNMARTVRSDRAGAGFLMTNPVSWNTSGEDWVADNSGRTIERVRITEDNVETDTVLSGWSPPSVETEIDIAGRKLISIKRRRLL